MTQRLCQAVSEAPAYLSLAACERGQGIRAIATVVDRLVETLFLTKEARDTDVNLSFVRNRRLRSDLDLAALLDVYRQVRARWPTG